MPRRAARVSPPRSYCLRGRRVQAPLLNFSAGAAGMESWNLAGKEYAALATAAAVFAVGAYMVRKARRKMPEAAHRPRGRRGAPRH